MATSAEHEAPRDPGDPRDPRAGGPKDHGPPPPAYEACATKSEGDACTLSFGDKAKAGKCTKPPTTAADARAFCLPEAVGGAAAAKGASNDRP